MTKSLIARLVVFECVILAFIVVLALSYTVAAFVLLVVANLFAAHIMRDIMRAARRKYE